MILTFRSSNPRLSLLLLPHTNKLVIVNWIIISSWGRPCAGAALYRDSASE